MQNNLSMLNKSLNEKENVKLLKIIPRNPILKLWLLIQNVYFGIEKQFHSQYKNYRYLDILNTFMFVKIFLHF